MQKRRGFLLSTACAALLSPTLLPRPRLPQIKVLDVGPASWGFKDFLNDARKRATADGTFFVQDHVAQDAKEIWLTNDECRQHYLMIGPTMNGMA